MSYLLDTNVISELLKPKADRGVLRWLDQQQRSSLHLSVLSIGEIHKGMEKPGLDADKRARIKHWLDSTLPQWLEGRMLPVDIAIAERWGHLQAQAGRTLPTIDSLLAATALHAGLTIATRNVADFRSFEGLEIINPWD